MCIIFEKFQIRKTVIKIHKSNNGIFSHTSMGFIGRIASLWKMQKQIENG